MDTITLHGITYNVEVAIANAGGLVLYNCPNFEYAFKLVNGRTDRFVVYRLETAKDDPFAWTNY